MTVSPPGVSPTAQVCRGAVEKVADRAGAAGVVGMQESLRLLPAAGGSRPTRPETAVTGLAK